MTDLSQNTVYDTSCFVISQNSTLVFVFRPDSRGHVKTVASDFRSLCGVLVKLLVRPWKGIRDIGILAIKLEG